MSQDIINCIDDKKRELLKKTYVCNCKVKYIRPVYDNLKDCLEDEENIYIGRKGVVIIDKNRYPKKDSVWANPYKVGKDGDLEEVLEKYKKHINKKIKEEDLDLDELLGKNLCCWCVEKPTRYKKDREIVCHGQILLNMLFDNSIHDNIC